MRNLADEIRADDLDIGAEDYEAEQADRAALEVADEAETEGEFYGCDDEDPNLDRDDAIMAEDPMPEPYENDLEEFGQNESFQDAMAEMAGEEYNAQFDE